MQIKDLLDRFELLYESNKNLADLRRSYTDKDLSSIFRLLDNEELRKAVMEKNLHSIFRLFNNDSERVEELRKAIIEGNLHSIFRSFSDNSEQVEELRKAVTEKNLHSIFRLIENEELRKAVLEENLYSIFRICENDDLRKLVLEDNWWSLWKILSQEIDTQFVSAFKSFHVNETEYDYDCFSRGQLASKLWLIKELKQLDIDLGTVFLCAGWYGTLAVMMFEAELSINKIRSFDIDPSCVTIAERFNKQWVMDEWKFKSCTKDIQEINYQQATYTVTAADGTSCELVDIPDTIINTSCEHIENFKQWFDSIPDGKLLILQTNDYFEIEDHVNCSSSLEEFADSSPLANCLYQGQLELPKYRRFLRIGYK